jgi:hypothetical protein
MQIVTHVSLLSEKRAHLGYIKLTETCQNEDVSFLPSTEPVPLLSDVGVSHFSRSETIAFARLSDPCVI